MPRCRSKIIIVSQFYTVSWLPNVSIVYYRSQYELVRYELSPLRNEIVNQSELYFYSPLKKAADV